MKGTIKEAASGLIHSLFADEIRLLICAILIFSFAGLTRFSFLLLCVGSLVSSVILYVYFTIENLPTKFFWFGCVGTIGFISYDPNSKSELYQNVYTPILPNAISQGFVILSTGVITGYILEKHMGNADFSPFLGRILYNRNILVLCDQSSLLENILIVSHINQFHLLDATRLTNTSNTFMLSSGERVSTMTVESKDAFSEITNLLRSSGEESTYCHLCRTPHAHEVFKCDSISVNTKGDLQNTINNLQLCDDCIEEVLELAVSKGLISKSELYAEIA